METGPNYATEINTAFNLVDAHDHSSGKGTQVTTAGLNINSDLTFATYNATNLNSTQYLSLTASLANTNQRAIYSIGGDLWWNNGNGTPVQLTLSSSLNTSGITGLSGTTAGLSYNSASSLFSFSQSPTTGSAVAMGTLQLYDVNGGTNAVILKNPGSMGAAYTYTFPSAVPSVSSSFTIDPSGQLGYRDLAFMSGANIKIVGNTSLLMSGVAVSISGTSNLDLVSPVSMRLSASSVSLSASTIALSGSVFLTGNLQMSGNNPTSANTGFKNTLIPGLIPKAWCTFKSIGALNAVAFVSGVNMSASNSTNSVTFTFATPMLDGEYHVTPMFQTAPQITGIYQPLISSKTANSFVLTFLSSTTGATINITNIIPTGSVAVFGFQ